MREAVEEYRKRGIAIVFIKPGEKRPERRGWTLKSEEPDDYTAGAQLGILTGALSGDLVCVDLDSPQALSLADSFLPPTPLIDGRPGKPRSHRWYRVKDVPPEHKAKCSGGIGGMRTRHFPGIDLLGTGAQAVAPPSLHPSGEIRSYVDPAAEPAIVDASELVRAVEAMATECGWRDHRAEATKYVNTIHAVEGANGGRQTFRAASALVNGFDLTVDDARPLLESWNETNATPKWDASDLERKLESAAERAGSDPRYPVGHLIRDGRAFDDPVLLASKFPGIWRCWNQRFYLYENGKYRHVPHGELSAAMLKHIDQQFGKAHARAMKQWKEGKLPKRRGVRKIDVSGAVDALAASRMIPSAYEMPCWIDGTKRNYVALRNSILDLDSLQSLPHSPEWFSTVRLDYDYLPDATEPRLEGWLRDWFGDDQELAALAQEWAGYCLTRSTDAQSFLMCIGDGANGKGAYAAMLQAIIGVDNCSYQGWSGLGERFGLAPVVGKQLNFSDEAAQFSRHTEETLKRYTGGSALTIEEKNQPAFKMLPTARLMAACNEFPRIVDRTDGFWRRLLLLPFTRKIVGRIEGMVKPSWWVENACMAGLLNWSLDGLRRLRGRGGFSTPRTSLSGAAALRREANPARLFLEESDLHGEIASSELYRNYRQWVCDNGLLPLSSIAFGREVGRAFPDAERIVKRVKGECVKTWRFAPQNNVTDQGVVTDAERIGNKHR